MTAGEPLDDEQECDKNRTEIGGLVSYQDCPRVEVSRGDLIEPSMGFAFSSQISFRSESIRLS